MRPEIVAEVTFLKPEEGGRAVPPYGGNYRPHLVVGDPNQRKCLLRDGNVGIEDYLGVEFDPGDRPCEAGKSRKFSMRLVYHPEVCYDLLVRNATFTVREGPQIVGFGRVIERREALAYTTRRATPLDAPQIVAAHLDSIRSLGARTYSADIVQDWTARLVENPGGDFYVKRMEGGETFYIALGVLDGNDVVLGFASHRVAEGEHRTIVYVRGAAARHGVGSALYRLAEAKGIADGARSIHVNASLGAVEFYKANGFEEMSRGEHRLRSGRLMPCVFMRKQLSAGKPKSSE